MGNASYSMNEIVSSEDEDRFMGIPWKDGTLLFHGERFLLPPNLLEHEFYLRQKALEKSRPLLKQKNLPGSNQLWFREIVML